MENETFSREKDIWTQKTPAAKIINSFWWPFEWDFVNPLDCDVHVNPATFAAMGIESKRAYRYMKVKRDSNEIGKRIRVCVLVCAYDLRLELLLSHSLIKEPHHLLMRLCAALLNKLNEMILLWTKVKVFFIVATLPPPPSHSSSSH